MWDSVPVEEPGLRHVCFQQYDHVCLVELLRTTRRKCLRPVHLRKKAARFMILSLSAKNTSTRQIEINITNVEVREALLKRLFHKAVMRAR
jgi:hypothetical protein